MMPETKVCQNCKNNFTIEAEDFAFYEKIKVPPPTFCFRCRLQRRLAWRNERALYKRTCDLCSRSIFSMYPSGTLFPVYCGDCWFSDTWDPMQYGREYDFSKNFFTQLKELQNVVPRIALQVSNVVNSDYTNQVMDCKNCYLITSGHDDEDCMFCYRVNRSKSVLDSFALMRCQNAYETFIGHASSNIFFSRGFADCLDLWFCDEMRASQNCFMSVNVRRKSYVFRNQQLSKEEYQKAFAEIDTGSYATTQALQKEFDAMVRTSLRAHGSFRNIVNTTGSALGNAKDCHYCFHGSDLERCRYSYLLDDIKDSMDINNAAVGGEMLYEMNTVGGGAFNAKFCNDAWPAITDLEYCDSCRSNAKDLFGCVSLRSKQYCVLNKQYTKEEYEMLVPKILRHMDEMKYEDAKGRVYGYGEFFPAELSLFPYNDSAAVDIFPLTETQAEEKGFAWNKGVEKNVAITLSADRIPDNIRDVDEKILQDIIGCEHAGKCNDRCTVGFKLAPTELQFYQQHRLPVPRLCPNCRHYERMRRRLPVDLFERRCPCDYKIYKNTTMHNHHPEGPCPNTFKTSYAPERPEIVYCETCYNAEVA